MISVCSSVQIKHSHERVDDPSHPPRVKGPLKLPVHQENEDGLDVIECTDENTMLESTASKRKLIGAKTLTD